MDSSISRACVPHELTKFQSNTYGSMLELICDNWEELSVNGVSAELRDALLIAFLEVTQSE